MNELLLTIDAGSRACRCVLFDLGGRVVGSGQSEYTTFHPRPGWAEIDPSDLRDAALLSIREALEDVEVDAIAGVGVSAQLGFVALAADGSAVSPILPWMDRRATAQAKTLATAMGAAEIYQVCGRRIDPEQMACKILWLKQEDPQAWNKTAHFVTIKDYLVRQLTGRVTIDQTHASYSLLFNVRTRQWESRILDALELEESRLPRVVDAHTPVGHCTGPLALATGLPKDVPVVSGCSDGSAGTLGAGLISQGDAVNVAGTTDVLLACTEETRFDPGMGTLVNCYPVAGMWAAGGPLSTTGGCLKWFCDTFADSAGTAQQWMARLEAEAGRIDPGAERLLCIPSLVGERTPSWDGNVRGVFFGISPGHRKAHFFRAILEGSVFGVKRCLTALEDLGVEVGGIRLVGGGARSRLSATIRADILGKPILLPAVSEATSLGTAILTGVGTGAFSGFDEAVGQMVSLTGTVEPNAATRGAYEDLFQEFLVLHDRLEDRFGALAGLDG